MRHKEWDDCSLKEKIQRWKELDKMLCALTPHERKHHFDMGVWGVKTECGTIGCAAGLAGLNPWFRRRGLQMNFTHVGDSYNDSFIRLQPEEFFGEVGYNIILTTTHPELTRVGRITVPMVVKVIREFIKFYLNAGEDEDAYYEKIYY